MKTGSKRVLVVEDDPGIAKLLSDNLAIDGFAVKVAANAHQALAACQSFLPDLVLLDVMLPDQSGFELCRVLRQGGRRHVIIVSALGQKVDKIRGLELGADDYVTKPFDIEELVARINAVFRRSKAVVERIQLGEVTVCFRTMKAWSSKSDVHLTYRELELLKCLAEHSGQVVHRDQLLSEVWGVIDGSTTRSVDYAIGRLRKKIETDPHNPHFIHTVHGDGYSLTIDGA